MSILQFWMSAISTNSKFSLHLSRVNFNLLFLFFNIQKRHQIENDKLNLCATNWTWKYIQNTWIPWIKGILFCTWILFCMYTLLYVYVHLYVRFCMYALLHVCTFVCTFLYVRPTLCVYICMYVNNQAGKNLHQLSEILTFLGLTGGQP